MRIALLAPGPVPAATGGAERAHTGIAAAFDVLSPHRCDVVTIPSPERDLAEVAASYLRFLDLDVASADAVLSTKYPAWMVDHPIHDVYLFHRLRGLDDTYPRQLAPRIGTGDRDLAELLGLLGGPATRSSARSAIDLVLDLAAAHPDDPRFAHPGPVGRALVRHLDAVGLAARHDRRFFVLSETVARRERGPAGLSSAPVVRLPSSLPGLRPGTYEYFFTASRLDGPKRIDLLIAAYRLVPGDVPLVIAGDGPEAPRLQELAAADDRVQLIGHVDDAELADHYRRALAVPFVPQVEDWGLVAVEAMAAATPVVTCSDSGGPLEVVVHEQTGLVVAPEAAAIAAALTRFVDDPSLAARMGDAALERQRGITWDAVVEALSPSPDQAVRSAAREPVPRWRRGRPKLTVLATYRVHPARHGGQLRTEHLARQLSQRFDVELVCLAATDDRVSTTVLADGLLQRVVPRSSAHREVEARWDGGAGMHVGDIVAGLASGCSTGFEDVARRALGDADVVVLSGPYLLELAGRWAPGRPFVYESHNCELDLKRAVMPAGPIGDQLLERVHELEDTATTAAAVRSVCSRGDAERLAAHYGMPVEAFVVVPNGVDVGRTRFTPPELRADAERRFLDRCAGERSPREQLCLFLGSHHPPNVDAARRLLQLAPALPEVQFVLAGGHTEALADGELPDNVAGLGELSDGAKRSLLGAAGLALNPMVLGSGTNLKLVEYLAAGVPVLTTAFGSRGVDLVDGVHGTVAELDEWPSAIRRARSGQTAAAGRSLAESYDWSIVAAPLVDAIHRLI